MRRAVAGTVVAVSLALALPACASALVHAPVRTSDCASAGGARCAGPAPIRQWVYGAITVSADGHVLSARFRCGGQLAAAQSETSVRLTYLASRIPAGGLACAVPLVSVRLDQPLGARTVVDATTGERLVVK